MRHIYVCMLLLVLHDWISIWLSDWQCCSKEFQCTDPKGVQFCEQPMYIALRPWTQRTFAFLLRVMVSSVQHTSVCHLLDIYEFCLRVLLFHSLFTFLSQYAGCAMARTVPAHAATVMRGRPAIPLQEAAPPDALQVGQGLAVTYVSIVFINMCVSTSPSVCLWVCLSSSLPCLPATTAK